MEKKVKRNEGKIVEEREWQHMQGKKTEERTGDKNKQREKKKNEKVTQQETGSQFLHKFSLFFFLPPAGEKPSGRKQSSSLSRLCPSSLSPFLHLFSPDLNPSRWGFISPFRRRGRWIYKGFACSPVDRLMLKCLTHKGLHKRLSSPWFYAEHQANLLQDSIDVACFTWEIRR